MTVITEQLPSALYRVRLEQGSMVTAHIADRIDRNFVRILVGGPRQADLHPAHAAAIAQVDLAQLAGRGRWRERGGQAAEHPDADLPHHEGDDDRSEEPDHRRQGHEQRLPTPPGTGPAPPDPVPVSDSHTQCGFR